MEAAISDNKNKEHITILDKINWYLSKPANPYTHRPVGTEDRGHYSSIIFRGSV